ncbi:hypothetical protein ISS07_02960 [Candidatus Woesearchaeota archaeon]|nr:hypothetical protein [Candidatus Woesearchaeota archaeon]
MSDIHSFLVNWSIKFLENKDIIRRNIVSVDKNKKGHDFIINYQENTKRFVVVFELTTDIFEKLKDENTGIFLLNSKDNLRFLVTNWKKFSENKSLSLYFVNPFSSTDKAWILHPNIHDKICDASSLELGLNSMADMVERTGKDAFQLKVKSEK